ncbi:hypothetical protein AMS59_17495, partial [Lysinibacillus sp. FJAT-14745]
HVFVFTLKRRNNKSEISVKIHATVVKNSLSYFCLELLLYIRVSLAKHFTRWARSGSVKASWRYVIDYELYIALLFI